MSMKNSLWHTLRYLAHQSQLREIRAWLRAPQNDAGAIAADALWKLNRHARASWISRETIYWLKSDCIKLWYERGLCQSVALQVQTLNWHTLQDDYQEFLLDVVREYLAMSGVEICPAARRIGHTLRSSLESDMINTAWHKRLYRIWFTLRLGWREWKSGVVNLARNLMALSMYRFYAHEHRFERDLLADHDGPVEPEDIYYPPDYSDCLTTEEEEQIAREEYAMTHGRCSSCGNEYGDGWTNCTCRQEIPF